MVDTLVYVANPGAGDMLQFMKAGLIELPDVFAVNKADLGPAAERTASELEAGLGRGDGKVPAPRTLLAAIPDLVFRLSREGIYLDYHAGDHTDLIIDGDMRGRRLGEAEAVAALLVRRGKALAVRRPPSGLLGFAQ